MTIAVHANEVSLNVVIGINEGAKMMRSGQQVSHPENYYQALLQEIMALSGTDPKGVAQYLGTSYISVARWIRGDIEPSADTIKNCMSYLRSSMRVWRSILRI